MRSLFACFAAVLLLPQLANAGAAKVEICHLTSSETNPYKLIEVSAKAADAHASHGDFVPFTIFLDLDGDGFGAAATGVGRQCEVPASYTLDATDCDDSNAAVSVDAKEICNDIDDDCDGEIDEGDVCGPAYGPWDAAADFSWENNPNGDWKYGYTYHNYGADPAGTFIPMPFSRQDGDMQFQNAWDWVQLYKNVGTVPFGNCADWCLKPGQLAMHPGNWTRGATMIVFTAPVDGTYAVDATFSPIDAQIGTYFWTDLCDVDTFVLVNGTTVHAQLLDSYDDSSVYVDTLQLSAGDEVRFVVQSNGYYYNDGTGIDAFIEMK